MKSITTTLCTLLLASGLLFQSCQEDTPLEGPENTIIQDKPITQKDSEQSSLTSKSLINYGDLHNCGLQFIRDQYPLNQNEPPNYAFLLTQTMNYMEASCSMPSLSTSQRAYLITFIEESPLNTVYPDEFVTSLIDLAIAQVPESADLFNTYKTLWSMAGSGKSQEAIEAFYSDEILNGDWTENDAYIVSIAEEIRIGSGNYWVNQGVATTFLEPETIADMIGGGIFTALGGAASFGLASPIAGAVGGLIVSATVEILVDNWGKW